MRTHLAAVRLTQDEVDVLDRWIANHQEADKEQLRHTDALRAAIAALAKAEAHRKRHNEWNATKRAQEAAERERWKRLQDMPF
jgi:hypothetical protein